MATYGTIYTYWAKNWDGNDPVELVNRVADAGLTGMEIHASEFAGWSEGRLADFKKLAEDRNVEINYTIYPTEDQGFSYYSDDTAVRAKTVEYMKRQIAWTVKMGGKVSNTTIHSTWPAKPVTPITDKEPYFEKIAECMKPVCKTAEDEGLLLATEISNRFEGFIVTTVAELKHLMELSGNPKALGITFDTFHANIEEDDMQAAVQLAGDKIFHVHMGEANRRLPGRGKQIDWDMFFGELKKLNYDKMLMVEPFVVTGGSVAYNTFLWRDLSGGADEAELTRQLRKSMEFIKSKFEK